MLSRFGDDDETFNPRQKLRNYSEQLELYQSDITSLYNSR